jgi:hypothetical protein
MQPLQTGSEGSASITKTNVTCETCFDLSVDAVKAAYIRENKTVSLLEREFVYCVVIDKESMTRAVKAGCQKCALVQDVVAFFNANLSEGVAGRKVLLRIPIDEGSLELTIRDFYFREINVQLITGKQVTSLL